MKKGFLVFIFFFIFSLFAVHNSSAQCSICTRTAQQLGEKPAKGLNAGIIYLGLTPFLLAGYIFFRWRRSNQVSN